MNNQANKTANVLCVNDCIRVCTVEQRHTILKLAKLLGIRVSPVSDIGGIFGDEVPTHLTFRPKSELVGWVAPGHGEVNVLDNIQFISRMVGTAIAQKKNSQQVECEQQFDLEKPYTCACDHTQQQLLFNLAAQLGVAYYAKHTKQPHNVGVWWNPKPSDKDCACLCGLAVQNMIRKHTKLSFYEMTKLLIFASKNGKHHKQHQTINVDFKISIDHDSVEITSAKVFESGVRLNDIGGRAHVWIPADQLTDLHAAQQEFVDK